MKDQSSRLRDLESVCASMHDARLAVHELERRRNALLCRLRAAGVPCTRLAEITGLSPGRVTQIVQAGSPTR